MEGGLIDGSQDMQVLTWIVFGGVAFSLVLIFVALRSALNGPQQRMRKRIASVKGTNLPAVIGNKSASAIKAGEAGGAGEQILRKLIPRPALLRARLERAGMSISLGTYVLVNLVLGVIAGGLVGWFFPVSILVAVFAGIAVGVGLPHMYVGMSISRRAKRFLANFPESIDLIVRGLQSGLPVTETMKSVGLEMPDPIGTVFTDIADGLKFGQTLDEALGVASKRLDAAEFKFFVISLSIQQETGGNLTETLNNLSEILRKRRQMRLKVRAMSSEARASAIIIGSLPFVMFGIIYMMNAGYLSLLFTDPRGMMMVGVVLTLMGFGIFVMQKMVRFEI